MIGFHFIAWFSRLEHHFNCCHSPLSWEDVSGEAGIVQMSNEMIGFRRQFFQNFGRDAIIPCCLVIFQLFGELLHRQLCDVKTSTSVQFGVKISFRCAEKSSDFSIAVFAHEPSFLRSGGQYSVVVFTFLLTFHKEQLVRCVGSKPYRNCLISLTCCSFNKIFISFDNLLKRLLC